MTASARTFTAKARFALMAASAVFLFAMPLAAGAVSTGLGETAQVAELPTGSIDDAIAGTVSAVMGLVGVAFLLLMIYGGFLWMTAAGDSKRVETAKAVIVSAVIGIVLIFAAYAITDTVFRALEGPSSGDTMVISQEEAGCTGTWDPTTEECIPANPY